MKNIRALSSTVFCASVLALSACGGGDATPTGAAATPTAAATSAAAASSAPAAAAGAASDKEICEAAVKAADAMKNQLMSALMNQQEPDEKALITAMNTSLAGLEPLVAGGTSDVAKSAQSVAAEVKKAAAAPDPLAAASSPEWEKAFLSLDNACTAAGVEVNFA